MALSLLVALAAMAVVMAQTPKVLLATFDGAKGTTWPWMAMNDPVMGGVSSSVFTVDKSNSQAVWVGVVRIVPSLRAPGFCEAETTNSIFELFNDASACTHLLLRVQTTTPNYAGYKVSFAADNIDRQFKSFKAPFNITGTDETTVAIPFNQFSNDWSPYTGDCFTKDPTGLQHYCCSASHPEVCPTAKNLRQINQLSLWTEGVAGNFSLNVIWIGAGTVTETDSEESYSASIPSVPEQDVMPSVDQSPRSSCQTPIQAHLQYNVSGRLARDYLPVGQFLPLESLPTAVCCDIAFRQYAEPSDFYARPDVGLFQHLNTTSGLTTFYDSACGKPVFMTPVNRTLSAFMADTTEHGWPSFRTGEVFLDNVIINITTGDISSTCGTHLGTYLPDDAGPRFCIDLVCISGNMA